VRASFRDGPISDGEAKSIACAYIAHREGDESVSQHPAGIAVAAANLPGGAVQFSINPLIYLAFVRGTSLASIRGTNLRHRRASSGRRTSASHDVSSERFVMASFDALSTAVSGLQAQSFALQNISGNIANSQTTAYKSKNTSFQDFMNTNLSASQDTGTVDALSNASNTVQGSIQTSTVGTFMAINGDGYFTVAKPSGVSSTGQPVFDGTKLYTRRGDFQPDGSGRLVNGAGFYLMGNPVDPASGNPTTGAPQVLQFTGNQTLSINQQGQIQGTSSGGQTVALAGVPLTTFRGEDFLQQGDGGTFTPTAQSGAAQSGALGRIVGSALEASNTDIASQFTTMIQTQQAYTANTKVVTTSDQMMLTLTNLTI
jgi:flagellar hook protein FlgE